MSSFPWVGCLPMLLVEAGHPTRILTGLDSILEFEISQDYIFEESITTTTKQEYKSVTKAKRRMNKIASLRSSAISAVKGSEEIAARKSVDSIVRSPYSIPTHPSRAQQATCLFIINFLSRRVHSQSLVAD